MTSVKQGEFYDQHPFDWVERFDPRDASAYVSPLLLRAIGELTLDALALDVGCGAGRVLSYLAFKNHRCFGFDRSANSVRLAARNAQRPVAVADNCSLPIPSGVADFVVSDGVIHHTDDPSHAFSENCRILKPGGLLYLAVYKPGGRYEFLHRYPGRLIRRGLASRATRWLVHLTALPLYYAWHFLRSGGRVSWRGARNLFYDYFASPRVAFFSREAVEGLCAGKNVTLAEYDSNPGANVHSFLIRKP
jgi:SAM-dependent methyltransferase